MKILHLFSDWKWTGPAEPVLELAQELSQRGHEVTFAYRQPPKPVERSIAAFVGNYKVSNTTQFRLNRYFSVTDNPRDIVALRRFIAHQGVDIVHCHLSHDHLLAVLATRGMRKHKPLLVRTDHKRDSLESSFGNRWLLRRTDGVMTFSLKAVEHLNKKLRVPADRICKVNPAIDCARFDPAKARPSLREKWGLKPDHVAIGVVARFQKYRKTDLFLEAIKMALPKAPQLRGILIGRSSQIEETVHKPIREMGLSEQVRAVGYLTDRYADGLASLDAFAFLIAGSDGTGRAMREAMAMAKPILANNVGMLPEMLVDGESGFVFNNSPSDLAEKMIRLANDAALRHRMGTAARNHARKEFSLTRQADITEEFYRHLLCSRS